LAGGPCGVPPEAALKILIHYGDTERPDKLHQSFAGLQVGRPSKFFRINLDAQSKFMSAEGGPREVRLGDEKRIFPLPDFRQVMV